MLYNKTLRMINCLPNTAKQFKQLNLAKMEDFFVFQLNLFCIDIATEVHASASLK